MQQFTSSLSDEVAAEVRAYGNKYGGGVRYIGAIMAAGTNATEYGALGKGRHPVFSCSVRSADANLAFFDEGLARLRLIAALCPHRNKWDELVNYGLTIDDDDVRILQPCFSACYL
jgi:hypothetical protein